MTTRARRWLGLAVVLALGGPLIVDWLWTSDEERVNATLDAMEAGLKARDADAVLLWCADEVAVHTTIPTFPSSRPFAQALRMSLASFDELSLGRDETKIEFAEEGVADVRTSGHGLAGMKSFGAGAFHFKFELKLRKGSDDKFRLESVEKVEVAPFGG